MPKTDKPDTKSVTETSSNKGDKSKRHLLQSLAATGVVGASIPEKSARPVVDSVMLPAHAQTTTGGPQFVGSVLNGITGNEPTLRNRSDDLVDFFISPAVAAEDLAGACIEIRSETGTLFDGDTLTYKIVNGTTLETGSATVSGNKYNGTMDGEPDVTISFEHVLVFGIVACIFVVIVDGPSTFSAFCCGGDGKTITCTTAFKETVTSSGATVPS